MRYFLKFICMFLITAPALGRAGDRAVELRLNDTRIRITRNSMGDVSDITVRTIDDSPLAVDKFLVTAAARGIDMDLNLTNRGRGYYPKRILALPSGGEATAARVNKHSDWSRDIPHALYSLEHVREHWLWPLDKGIPILVEYECGEWGFLNITASTRVQRTKIELYAFSGPVPASAEELLDRIHSEGKWPTPKLADYQQMGESEYRKHYLAKGAEKLLKLRESMRVNLDFIKPYLNIEELFTSRKTDRARLKSTFEELWQLAEMESQKNTSDQSYPHFDISHWAVIDLLGHASEDNLQFLMDYFESEILLTARLSAAALPAKFFVALFNVSNPVRPTRVEAINLLLDSRSLNRKGSAAQFERLRERITYLFTFQPTTFFAELRTTSPSDSTVQFLFDTYINHVPSNIRGDSLYLSWLMSLVAQGRDTAGMRGFIEYYRKSDVNHVVYEDALEWGQRKKMFECSAIIELLKK